MRGSIRLGGLRLGRFFARGWVMLPASFCLTNMLGALPQAWHTASQRIAMRVLRFIVDGACGVMRCRSPGR
jgi:hypothetical protein